jgi:hypothetical protein
MRSIQSTLSKTQRASPQAACNAIAVARLRGNLLYGTWTQSANPTRNSPWLLAWPLAMIGVL